MTRFSLSLLWEARDKWAQPSPSSLKQRKNAEKSDHRGLPSGLLGIGEPLIFGVTLPLGRPFLTACLGAGIGGAFQAYFQVATVALGVSGLPLSFLVLPSQIILYIIGLFISYAAGFLLTYAFGYKDEMAAQFD